MYISTKFNNKAVVLFYKANEFGYTIRKGIIEKTMITIGNESEPKIEYRILSKHKDEDDERADIIIQDHVFSTTYGLKSAIKNVEKLKVDRILDKIDESFPDESLSRGGRR